MTQARPSVSANERGAPRLLRHAASLWFFQSNTLLIKGLAMH